MLSIINCMTIQGIDGYKIEVQVDTSNGMPGWDIVRTSRYKYKRIKRKGKNCNKKFRI